MCRWPSCSRRHGAYANATPATVAPARVRAELAREQVRADEAQRVGEQEEEVVARDGGVDAFADQTGRRVPDERVGEREAVGQRPEHVRLKEGERLRLQRMPVPRDLPRLHERVTEVLRDVAPEVQRQRPVHREREHDCKRHAPADLARGQARVAVEHSRIIPGRTDGGCVDLPARGRVDRHTSPPRTRGRQRAAKTMSRSRSTDQRPRRHAILVPSARRTVALPRRGSPQSVASSGRSDCGVSPRPAAT